MSRIELDDLPHDETRKRSEPRPWRKSRPGRRRLNCCLFIFVVLLFGLAVAAAVVAKSGIIHIPVFSKAFYRLPLPTHVVAVDTNTNTELVITADPSAGTAMLTITEAQLTSALRRGVGSYDAIAMQTAQAAILPEGVELYGLVVRPLRITITALVVPRVENNHLVVSMQRVMVGNLLLPPSWGSRLLEWLLGAAFTQTTQSMSTLAIERIELHNGVLDVVLPITSPLLNTNAPVDRTPNFLN